MLCLYSILWLCIVASCNQDDDWLKCKPKAGCSIARCDPIPSRWFGSAGIDNEYPILCQQNGPSSSTTENTETAAKFAEIQREFVKLEGRLEKSETEEFNMKLEIKLLERKIAEMEGETNRPETDANKSKGKLEDALRRIVLLEKRSTDTKSEDDTNTDITKENEAVASTNDAENMNRINPCDLSPCDSNATCKKVDDKRHICKCIPGYAGDGMSCRKVIPCKVNRCHLNAACENVDDHIYTCKCLPGYSGDGKSCKTRLCPVKYDDKCFIPVMESKVVYDGAYTACRHLGGYLANIYSQTHMDAVMKYVREIGVFDSINMSFYLGMRIDPKTKRMALRNGTDIPADMKWYPSYPNLEKVDRKYGLLIVGRYQSLTNQYLFNDNAGHYSYVLCEVE